MAPELLANWERGSGRVRPTRQGNGRIYPSVSVTVVRGRKRLHGCALQSTENKLLGETFEC